MKVSSAGCLTSALRLPDARNAPFVLKTRQTRRIAALGVRRNENWNAFRTLSQKREFFSLNEFLAQLVNYSRCCYKVALDSLSLGSDFYEFTLRSDKVGIIFHRVRLNIRLTLISTKNKVKLKVVLA